MNVFVFDFSDYKAYLNAYIAALPKRGYGFKSRLAEAANCKTAYIAQVLNGVAHFSLEQAENLNTTLGHDDLESEFFLLLVQLARAGTEKLRRRLRSQIQALHERQNNLKQRFRANTELGERELLEYFSRWSVNAVHLATTIPRLRSKEKIMQALDLDSATAAEALQFLKGVGLVREERGQLLPGQSRIFIGKDSPILKVHHAGWRGKAVQSLDHGAMHDLHFTSVYSLSEKDAATIRERLIREIETVRGIVKDSPEEILQTFTLDFFRVDRV